MSAIFIEMDNFAPIICCNLPLELITVDKFCVKPPVICA